MPYTKQEDRAKFLPLLEQFPELSDNDLIYVFVKIGLLFGGVEISTYHNYLLDPILSQLRNLLPFTVGDMNFMFTWLIHMAVIDRGLRYVNLNDMRALFEQALVKHRAMVGVNIPFQGVCLCAGDEFYRRIVVPYETLKIKENGVISELEHDLNPDDYNYNIRRDK
jgi:hypothetical protein